MAVKAHSSSSWQTPILKGYISPYIFACHFIRIGVGAEYKRLHPGFNHSAIIPTTQVRSSAPNSEIAES